MSKSKVLTFNVIVDAKVNFNVPIRALTLEDAIQQARAKKTYELLDERDDSWNDYDHEIVGVFK